MDDWLGELELRVVEAARQLFARDGSPAAANGSVGSRNPNAVDLDTALDGTDAEWDFILSLFAHLSYRLSLEHLRRLHAFALVDLAVLAELVFVEGDLDEANEDSQDNSACEDLGYHVSQ